MEDYARKTGYKMHALAAKKTSYKMHALARNTPSIALPKKIYPRRLNK